jgi:NADPH:quinone reductase-like Zn-dependent oxidoreductase
MSSCKKWITNIITERAMVNNHTRVSKIPKTMNAVRLHTANGPAGVIYEQIETPEPKAREALVRVYAAAITRDELDWPVNRLPAIPSYEFSGVVSAIGQGVDGITVGDQVYALSAFDRDGAAADYMVVSQEFLAPKPRTLDYVQSASIPLAALTAWQGLFDHGQLSKGQRVLIHGATGGVGHFAVQLARLHGANVIGTVSTRNVEAAGKLGLVEVIEHPITRFEEVVDRVDLVFDTVGGDRLNRSPFVVRPGGRLVSVASEPSQEQATARQIKALYFVVEPNGKQLVELAKLADNGDLQPAIDEIFPLANARQAFERSMSAHTAGKIVLRIVDE